MNANKVLITGVYGLIGGAVYRHLVDRPVRYTVHGLSRRRVPSDRSSPNRDLNIPDARFVLSNLSDLDVLVEAFQDIDVVVHMAADPRADAPWESVLASNIVGARNVLEAARIAGVERVVFASSIMVSWGYLDEYPYSLVRDGRYDAISPEAITPVKHTWPTRPTNDYPASKVWGEALARVYAEQRGLPVICLRIGWVNDEDYPHTHGWARAGWCSQRDVVQLVERSIQAPPDVQFEIFYALSDNAYRWADIEHAKEVLGYDPQDSADDFYGEADGS
jgi:nucleoside-diphosphate-sugar epimerase